jgi:hypothetical protein
VADPAGALAAINARFAAEWGDRTRIAEMNRAPEAPWPPKDAEKKPLPWVLIEPTFATSDIYGVGEPGKRLWRYDGLIAIHVFVPVGNGTAIAFSLARDAGEVFRGRKFYDATPGCYVRSWSPRFDGGGVADDRKAYFRVTAMIPFEYWHRG